MIDISLGRIMEDQFFLKKDQLLIEARKKLEAMKETKANLMQVSGIKDEAVLDKLIQLNIRPDVLATLFAIPLIEVAWADGELQDQERDELFRFVHKAGLRNKQVDTIMISVWLKQKPGPELMEAWEHYIQALSQQLSPEERQSLKEEVLADARTIANAAGGFLGFGTLSPEEQKVLDQLEAAFN
jgi:hypothetical protein